MSATKDYLINMAEAVMDSLGLDIHDDESFWAIQDAITAGASFTVSMPGAVSNICGGCAVNLIGTPRFRGAEWHPFISPGAGCFWCQSSY